MKSYKTLEDIKINEFIKNINSKTHEELCNFILNDFLRFKQHIKKNKERKQNTKKNKINYVINKKPYCTFCKLTKNQTILHIHHINENHDDNKISNLLTVCGKYHIKLHKGKRNKKGNITLHVFFD